MARPQRQTEVEIENARNEENQSEFQRDVEGIEQSILSEFDQDVENVTFVMKVYRVVGNNKTGGTEEWIFNCDPSELPIVQRLRDEFTQPGTSQVYRVRVIRNKVPYRQWDYRIFRPVGDRPAETRNELNGFASTLAEVLRENQRQTLEFMQRIEQRISAPAVQQPPFDPAGMMRSQIELFTAMQNAMPKPENNMIEIFRMGMEMANKAESGGSVGIMNVIQTLAEKIDFSQFKMPVVPGTPGVPVQQPAPVPRPARPAYIPQRGPVSAVPPPAHASPLAPFAPQLQMLLTRAARGKDKYGDFICMPETWAEVLMEELSDSAMDALLNLPDTLGECEKVVPAVAQHRPWFSRLLATLREAWQESREAEPDNLSRSGLHSTAGETGEFGGDTKRSGGDGRDLAPDAAIHQTG